MTQPPDKKKRVAHSKINSYGFEHGEDEDYDDAAHQEFMSSYLIVLARRDARWRPHVAGKDRVHKSAKIKRFCRKGIPGEHRPLVWMEVSGAGERMRAAPDLYRQLLTGQPDPQVADSIQLDIHRTFPENIYFADIRDPAGLQKPLKNVLTAYALHNPSTGYCQGLNFIAGMMLIILRNEEKTFWLLDTVTKHKLPGNFYSPEMTAMKAEQELLGDMIKWKVPELHSHLERLGLSWSLVCMKWFICLFADVLPVETVLRIWDCLFYEGGKVLMRVAVAMVRQRRAELMAAGNFSEAMDVFKAMVRQPTVINCHSFMQSIFNDTNPMPSARISKMRGECMRRV